ncbi:alkaline phosphatase family protein [Kitasatospora aureofaciens]|uniref:alkaline phosphatase family protein n=1 Tax=Kitasatospora aureofaciens TaxID=1894 RepID=UPI000527056A|nr:alkaline phosphatase family protein [Kitasatospora aureofaciens]
MPFPTARSRTTLVLAAAVAGATTAAALTAGTSASAAATLPSPDHIVVVMLENHAYGQIIGSSDAPFLNSLATGGALLKASYGITHPSQPNYFAVFSGSTQGITDDSCYSPGFSKAPNLASELSAAGKSWGSYSEALPSQGSTTCSSGNYARKHAPWVGFGNIPGSTEHTFAQFPSDYGTLPKVSFVIPDLCSDMHNCSVGTGDSWLKNKLGGYASWARSHNSLLVVTYDEDDRNSGNHIPTLIYGQPARAGATSSTSYNHYDLLHTLEDLAGTGAHAGKSASATDITGVWN